MKTSRSKIALRVSLVVSAVSLILKTTGFFVTNATTALSDAAESIIHILAVGFVYYGLYLSTKPADEDHLYGHERIEFFTVGIEGGVITLAGLTIIYQAVENYISGYQLQNLTQGIYLLTAAGIVNLFLGLYLIRTGRREQNMMVISNGKHTLTDVWTTGSAIATLVIISYTDWLVLDSAVSIVLAFYIMFEGYKLIKYSVNGLMDTRDPEADKIIQDILSEPLPGSMVNCHNLRHRTTGSTTWVEFHALFEEDVSLQRAHEDATRLERKLIDALKGDVIVTIHLEPEGVHDEAHELLKDASQDRPLEDFI